MSDVRRAEAAARDLSQARAELRRWIRRALEAERMIESVREKHAAELLECHREIATLRAELERLALQAAGPTQNDATRAA
jgi:hypothetical protein